MPEPLPSSATRPVSGRQAPRSTDRIRSRRPPNSAASGRTTGTPNERPSAGSAVIPRHSASTSRRARERSRSPEAITPSASSRTRPHSRSYLPIDRRPFSGVTTATESTGRPAGGALPAPRRGTRGPVACGPPGASGVPVEPARLPARVQALERLPDRGRVVRRDDDARARLADQLGGGAVGGNRGEDRPLGGEILEHLPGEHAASSSARVGDQQEQRLRVPLQLERAAAGDVRDQLQPVAEPEALRPLAVGRAEVADEPGDDVEPRVGQRGDERPRVAAAEEAARMGDPEPLRRAVLHPVEVVEVGAVLDRHHAAPRLERTRLVGDRVRRRDDRVGVARHEPGDAPLALLLDPHEPALVAATMRMGDERVPQVGDPPRTGRALDRGSDEVHRARRRGRQHDVDPLAAHDPDRGRNRGQVPGDVLVGNEQPPAEEPRLHAEPLEPLLAVQLLRRQPAAGPEVAGTVDPRLGRRQELVVAVDPLRVVGREHVRLDPEAGQVRGRLQRALDAAASGRREVHRDEQDLHRRRR